MTLSPPCFDCLEPISDHPMSKKYPPGADWSRCYLCAVCRHRYKTEAHASARIRAGLARREAA